MYKIFFSLSITLVLVYTSYGQSEKSIVLGFNVSSQGVGLETDILKWSQNTFVLRGGLSYFGYASPFTIKAEEGTFLEVEPTIHSLHSKISIDHYPFRKRVFYLSTGLGANLYRKFEGTFYTLDRIKLGGIEMMAEDFGVVNLQIAWHRVRPFVGLGFKPFEFKKRINMGVEMGGIYAGSPRLKMSYEGFLETTTIDDEVLKIQNNLKNYVFHPYISFQIRYKLK
jgi:hypothetical protein